MFLKRLGAAIIVNAMIAGAALAQTSVSYDGTNDPGDGSWDRPIAGGPTISGLGPVQFSVQAFTTDTTDIYDLSSAQDYDGYIHLYAGSFDPTDQLANLIDGDDDGDGGIGTSDLDAVSLTAGVVYFLVTSAFAAGDVGTFTNTIESLNFDAVITLLDGSTNVIPLPAAFPLFLAGLAGLGVARRRKTA